MGPATQAGETTMTVDPETFKDLMARFPAGVAVVTTDHEGARHGLTVSAFASVSLSPPLVLACIDVDAESHDMIAASGIFGVSFLSEKQEHLSDRFAGFDDVDDRFEGIETTTLETGAPLLVEALARADCRVEKIIEAGDHSIFIGRLVDADVPRPGARPLAYWNRGYHRLEDLSGSG